MKEPNPQLDAAERLNRLRLIRTVNIGPVTFQQLLRRFGSATAALEVLPELAARGGRRGAPRICSRAEAEAELAQMQKLGGCHLVQGDPDYPMSLAAIADAPPVLCALGRTEYLDRPSLGIVGARNGSSNALRLATRFGEVMGQQGFTIVSGLARGIDAAAHRGGLDTGTIAVLAGGVDVIYPKENADLHGNIREKGLLLSEMPPSLKPQARHFPRRNRIISGLSLGVLVVEAALKSGSLITARFAADQGREVFAVPGSPMDPRARGCNDLIRNGAWLTETADDILNALGDPVFPAHIAEPDIPAVEPLPELDPGEHHERILAALSPAPTHVDLLVRDLDLPAAIVRGALLELELAGRLERRVDGAIALI